MQKFQFALLTYWLDSTVFLKEVVRTCLCVVIFKTIILKAQSHFTLTALPEHFSCHTPGLTHATPQLRLRRDRPMFAAAHLKPSNTLFNFRWSTQWPWYSPFWSSVFLTRVNRKSLCEIFLPPQEE
jgi:hypothetical protein